MIKFEIKDNRPVHYCCWPIGVLLAKDREKKIRCPNCGLSPSKELLMEIFLRDCEVPDHNYYSGGILIVYLDQIRFTLSYTTIDFSGVCFENTGRPFNE